MMEQAVTTKTEKPKRTSALPRPVLLLYDKSRIEEKDFDAIAALGYVHLIPFAPNNNPNVYEPLLELHFLQEGK
jgi:hypothetical protein